MNAGHDKSRNRKTREELLALKDGPRTHLEKFLDLLVIVLVIGGALLIAWTYEHLPFHIPFSGFIACLLLSLFAILVILGLGALTTKLLPSKPYPPNTFTPEEWEDFLRNARPARQKDLLLRTNHQSLGLRSHEFLEILQNAREHIWNQVHGVYIKRCGQLEEELRKQREEEQR